MSAPLAKFRTTDFRPVPFIAQASNDTAMGWITRRIAGSVTFVIVSAILTAWAVATGHLSGSPTLSTAWGAGILGVAFLVSLAVTHRMKAQDQIRKAWEDNARAWQEYWARAYAAQYRRR